MGTLKAMSEVLISPIAQKQLRKVPRHIVMKLAGWVLLVKTEGLFEARKIPGYNDEALKGKRQEQRSIRLSKAYRAIYTVNEEQKIELVTIQEVSKHDY